jgi:hypothetical protein
MVPLSFVLVAVWWLLLLLLLLSSSGLGLQQQHSSSTTTNTKKYTALSSFQFSAETGRCVRPRFFVEPAAGEESSDDITRTAARNGEDEIRLNCGGGGGGSGNWFELQNVRGDGDCVFLAILQRYGTNDSVDGVRRRVANVLQNGREIVKISADTKVPASALLQQAALELNCSKSEYLHRLRTPGRYGGLYGGLYEYIFVTISQRRFVPTNVSFFRRLCLYYALRTTFWDNIIRRTRNGRVVALVAVSDCSV